MLEIIPTEASEVTRLTCPKCGEKVPRVGIKKGSHIEGLTFKCKRCGELCEVIAKTEYTREP